MTKYAFCIEDMDDTQTWLSRVLPENYALVDILGKGGMGVVFRVNHTEWGIPLAVKVPLAHHQRTQAAAFLQEAEMWSDIGLHPYIATLYYVREFDSRSCTFCELVEMGGLDKALRSRLYLGTDDETTLSRILSLAASTAWGLDAAHKAGLVHCDFKPGNALLEPDFTAKVTDFGLARNDQNGAFVCPGGTPLYASPEQARGDKLTAATDFWSWAATCFEMFIGEPSWQSGSAVGAALEEFIESGGKCPGLPRIPADFTGILENCLSCKPSHRPGSFREIAEQICGLHTELLSEPCPATEPDVTLVTADALNNRAVSLIDIGSEQRANQLLLDAIKNDPLHPEALFNYHVFLNGKNADSIKRAEQQLIASSRIDKLNNTPLLLLSRMYSFLGRQRDAEQYFDLAMEQNRPDFAGSLIPFPATPRIVPVLAKPMSGAEFSYHKDRFFRLISKGKSAVASNDSNNASRYVLMAGDIPGFARHPELHKLRCILKS